MGAKRIETRVLLVSFTCVLIVEACSGFAAAAMGYPSLVGVGAARMVEVPLLLFIVSNRGKGLSSIGLGREEAAGGLMKGLVWSALFGICALSGFAIMHALNLNPLTMIRTHLPPDARGRVLYFVVGGLISPVAEEIFFRGVVYGFLRRWGVIAAVPGSTFVFVAPHLPAGGIPVAQIVGGVLFAAAYEVEGNLLVPITIHVLGNTAIFFLSLCLL